MNKWKQSMESRPMKRHGILQVKKWDRENWNQKMLKVNAQRDDRIKKKKKKKKTRM